jgi:hypothetical protein
MRGGIRLLPLMILALLAGCADDLPLGGDGEAPGGSLLAVAGFQRLQLRSAGDPRSLQWETGLGQAANGLLPVGDRLFVLNSLSHQLQVIERVDGRLHAAAMFDLGLVAGANPYDLAWHEGQLLMTELLANQVSRWDPDTGERLGGFSTAPAPQGLLLDGERLFVVGTNFDFQALEFRRGWLMVHEAASGARQDSLQLGLNPQFLARDPLGRLHVTCTGDYGSRPGEIWILSLDPLRVEQVLSCPLGYPGRIVIAPWGQAYVAAGGWQSAGAEAGIVLHYAWATGEGLAAVATGRGVLDLALDEERGGLWALCMDEPSLDWIDPAAGPSERIGLPEPAQRLVLWPR